MPHTEIEKDEPDPFEKPEIFSTSGEKILSVRVAPSEVIPIEEINRTEFGYFLVSKGRVVTVLGKHLPIFNNPTREEEWAIQIDVIFPALFNRRSGEKLDYYEMLSDAIILSPNEIMNTPIGTIIEKNRRIVNIVCKIIPAKKTYEVDKYIWNAYIDKWPPLKYIQDNLLMFHNQIPNFKFPPSIEDKTSYGYCVKIGKSKKRNLYIVEEHKLINQILIPGVHFFIDRVPEELILQYPDKFKT